MVDFNTTIQVITSAVAVVALFLSTVNFIRDVNRDRPKLIIVPKQAWQIEAMGRIASFNSSRKRTKDYPWEQLKPTLSFEVINRSNFPLTIDEVGVFYRGKKERGILHSPQMRDGGELPYRLEPRSSVSFYTDEFSSAGLLRDGDVRCSFVGTSCGLIRTGKSPALKQLVGFYKTLS